MWDSCDCSYKCDIMCWLLGLSTKSINAVAKFLEVFFTDCWTERQTDRQTDRQAHRLALPLLCVHTSSGSAESCPQTPRGSEGLGTRLWYCCVCVCVCTVFCVLKLFMVLLAIFTAGSKPTSKAKLFPHISRWWETHSMRAALPPLRRLPQHWCWRNFWKGRLWGNWALYSNSHTHTHTHTLLLYVESSCWALVN